MGIPVALAVIAHDFADGFNTYTLTRVYGNARRRALAMPCADAAAHPARSTLLCTIAGAAFIWLVVGVAE